MMSPNIDPIRTARGAGRELFARSPRASFAVIGRIQEPAAPGKQGAVVRWTVTEKLDHLILGQDVAEFATADEAMHCLLAYRLAGREAAR